MRALIALALALAPAVAGATDDDAPSARPEDAPSATEVRPEDRLPDDPAVTQGKAAYNEGRYNEASRVFLQLAQKYPTMPALYRALARSRTWAGEPAGAVLAYQTYLKLADAPADKAKVEAELELARRKAAKVPEAPPGSDALDAAVAYAGAGTFSGPNSAYGQLDAATEAGYFGPRLAQVREQIADALSSQSRDAVARWYQPEAQVDAAVLLKLQAGWAAQTPRRAPTPAEAALAAAMKGLAHLAAAEWALAAETLQPAAPGDHRLRFAQALAFARAGRDEDAVALLEALTRHHGEARIRLLRGLVLNRMGRTEEGVAELKAALLD